jgi:hypothetical protein
MAKFRKKPVVIEAMQFQGMSVTNSAYQEILDAWLLKNQGDRKCRYVGNTIVIPTLEGDHTASPGDWIIRGVQGELYPCKPDIFAKTYDPA